MKNFLPILFTIIILFFASCKADKNNFDASGAFESVETIISTEASGTIMQFEVEEGQTLQEGQKVGYIDSIQEYLRKRQLQAQINSIISQIPNVPIQVASLREQLKEAEVNQQRVNNLVKLNAATQKELDDINSQVEVIKKQISAQISSLGIATVTFSRNIIPIEQQIAQIDDQLSKCRIINKIHGTVLTKYAEKYETAIPGKALYKIAELDTLILRAYITGTQLSQIKLRQKVDVRTDNGPKNYRHYSGVIYWISDKAEFTPKTIQTKEERADLVYAIKIRVINDGFLKIGMYGEIQFSKT